MNILIQVSLFFFFLRRSLYLHIYHTITYECTHTHTHMLCLHFCSFFVFLADEIFLATLSCSLLLSLRNVP
uniref:Uncharacterized protein n=1 Tax=Theropithecus gelada TaxID=9565 RepID=A0A8D2GG20_THEGE